MTIEPFFHDDYSTVYYGNALQVLKTLPNQSVNMVMLSPPYWGLRNYAGGDDLVWGGDDKCQHEWGAVIVNPVRSNWNTFKKQYQNPGSHDTTIGATMKPAQNSQSSTQSTFCVKCGAWIGQLGLEPDPDLYVEHLMMIFREVKRILKKDGSFYINIADTYVSGKGSCYNPGGGDRSWNRWNERKMTYPAGRSAPARMYKGVRPKCMALIPERVEFAMLLDGWRLRNKITWHKPNNMPSSVKDRFTQTCENLFFFVKSRKYYFDLDAVRIPNNPASLKRYQGQDGLFSDGPNPGSFRLRVRDVALGKIGASVQNDAIATEEEVRDFIDRTGSYGGSPLSEEELERYGVAKAQMLAEIPSAGDCGQFDDRVKHHGSRMNNRSRLHLDRINGIAPHVFNPLGKNPGDLWSISTRPSTISVCPQCDTVFRRLMKECPHCHVKGIIGHFAPYPEEICIDPIKASTRVGDVVLDCFGGSGTTAVAARKLGRRGIVIDCVRAYCVMSRYNLQQVAYQAKLEV